MTDKLVFKGKEIIPFDNGDGKVWFSSTQMAALLEYKREKSVTNLYNANKDEFSDDMTMVTETMTNCMHTAKIWAEKYSGQKSKPVSRLR